MPQTVDIAKLDSFTQGYLECALWSSTDEDGTPLDSKYCVQDIAPESLAQMISDCEDFQSANAELLKAWDTAGRGADYAGHDFWLTRNGHGTGFWDRFNSETPEGKIGQQLTDAAHAYGSRDLYVGDDESLYCQ